jgi:hypothetical protein
MHIQGTERERLRGLAVAGCGFIAVLALLVSAMMPAASAVEMATLYTVEVPFDRDDPNGRNEAYRAALMEILVRVTGTTAAGQSEQLAGLFPDPAQFVTQYRPGSDDTLVVALDGATIERMLRQAGATVWGPDRPLTVVWLAVDWGMGAREIVAADDPQRLAATRSIDRNRLLRERVQEVATRRGLPIVFPLLDTEDLENIGFSDVWGGFDDQLLAASARYEATSVLVGRIRAESAQPARWTWYFDGQRIAWPGTPEDALDQLADTLASRFAIRGDEARETIELTISGIDSVVAYARVQSYLQNLRVVDRLMVKSAMAGRITYDVEVQGGLDRLESALKLAEMLQRVGRGFGIDTRSFDDGPFDFDRASSGPAVQAIEYRYLADTFPLGSPRADPGN